MADRHICTFHTLPHQPPSSYATFYLIIRAQPYLLFMMSNNPSHHQPHSRTVLPPIGNLIDAADRGMYHKYNERQRYPPTSEAAAHGSYPSMHGQGVHLPANMAHHGAQARGRGDPHYPTPPNSTRPEVTTYPTQAGSTSGGGASSRRHVCTECGQAFDRPSSLQVRLHNTFLVRRLIIPFAIGYPDPHAYTHRGAT